MDINGNPLAIIVQLIANIVQLIAIIVQLIAIIVQLKPSDAISPT